MRGLLFPLRAVFAPADNTASNSLFQGKRVIVTGGANGIGKGTVARFTAEGAAVVLRDVSREAAEAAARRHGVILSSGRPDVRNARVDSRCAN